MKPKPVGPLSLAVDNLRKLVAASDSFQRWTRTGNAQAALARVHYAALPKPDDGVKYRLDELQAYRPYVVADIDRASGGFDRVKVAEPNVYEDSGKLLMFVEADVDAALLDRYPAAETPFMNHLAELLDNMAALSGVAGYLTIHRFTIEGPHRSDVREANSTGDFHHAIVSIEWGV